MALKPIQILINAKDEASAVFDKLQTKVAAVGAAILGYFGIKAFAGVVQGAADFQTAMSRVEAATGASADEMARLSAAAEQTGASTKFTAVDAAGALENLAKAGLSASDAIATLPGVTALAQAADIDLAQSAEFVTKAVSGMGLAWSDATRVADVLAKGANATNTSVTGLAQALSYAAPVASSLGLSLESTVAIIGKFADAGIDASRAGTALNSILSQFSNPASKFRDELAAAGITTSNFEDALHQLAAAGPSGQRAILAVGQEAGPALRALLGQGMGALDGLTESLRNAGGSAAATAATMQNNLNGALAGLRSAWDAVIIRLGTPVLPVVQQAVEKLAGALQSAVNGGLIDRFGKAIASAFQAAAEWASKFIGSVDFDAVVARLQAFATSAQQTFDQIGQAATNAGNIVKLAYGVMAAGVNTVLVAIYGIGSVFAEVASTIMAGVEKLRSGLATVTFGQLSASFQEAADDARISSEAFGAAAQAMRDKAAQSMSDMTDAAVLARDGFAGLSGSVEEAAGVTGEVAKSWADYVKEAEASVAANAAAQAQIEKAADAQQQAAAKTEAAAQAHAELRAEYQQAIDTGNLQRAAEVMAQLQGTSARAAASAEDVAAAFERAGLQTKEQLRTAAETAAQDYELIKASGQATAEGVAQAWQRMAEAAIAANGGVASDTIRAQAAMHGLEVATDSAGRSIVQAMNAGAGAVSGLESSLRGASAAAAEYVGWAERMAKRNAEVKSTSMTDAQGFSADAKGNRITMGGDLTTLTGVKNFLMQAGLDEQQAKRVALEFSDGKGNIQYFNNPGQKKYGGEFSTISDALLKAAERVTFGMGGAGGAPIGKVVKIDFGDEGSATMDESSADAVLAALRRAKRASR